MAKRNRKLGGSFNPFYVMENPGQGLVGVLAGLHVYEGGDYGPQQILDFSEALTFEGEIGPFSIGIRGSLAGVAWAELMGKEVALVYLGKRKPKKGKNEYHHFAVEEIEYEDGETRSVDLLLEVYAEAAAEEAEREAAGK